MAEEANNPIDAPQQAAPQTPTGHKPESRQPQQMEEGTYQIIQKRLRNQGAELRKRLESLNAARKEVFGSIPTTLMGTDRVTTAHNCVPRDIAAVGKQLLFGYNVHIGLKSETSIEDVFAVYTFEDGAFHAHSLDLIRTDEFEKDFRDTYRYYKETTFAKFFRKGPHLYFVCRTGKRPTDIKAFKWLVEGDALRYVDNRSEHEVSYPPQHEFEWLRATRDQHRTGRHPHISIDDKVFVETIGGDLTIKVENNTDSGEGVYTEPVDHRDQTLDDAEIAYAHVGHLVLLRIRPYQETQDRHFIFNAKLKSVHRIDSVANACVLLPEDHGLIFANGYYLHTGDTQVFPDAALQGMMFERRIPASNGEDYLYVFYNRSTGTYALLSYNLIEQRVQTPIVCSGFSLFDDGELVYFKAHEEPQKHHAIQIWQTPYVGPDYVPPKQSDSYLFKVGNREIVRGMSECVELINLIEKDETYADLYVDIVRKADDIIESYFWLNRDEAAHLDEVLRLIKDAGSAAIGEFEKVTRIRRNTTRQVQKVTQETDDLLRTIRNRRYESIADFVDGLANLRRVRGEIISLRELRYVDIDKTKQQEKVVQEQSERLAERCVEFLLKDDSLTPYEHAAAEQQAAIDVLSKVTEAKELGERIDKTSNELEMLIETVSNLRIDDAVQRTQIIDNISAIFSRINAARATLRTRTQDLLREEGSAEFHSQLRLLNQSVANYLEVCETPEQCDEYLTRLMVHLEELEGRFAEFDEFVVQLSEKRDEVYSAMEARKLQLVEARNRRTSALSSAAERILKGIKSRVDRLESFNDINAYFVSDLMVEKVRDIVTQLADVDATTQVDRIQTQLKTIREDAVRQLKDRQELYVGGENVIQFGRHKFSVNTQPFELTTVVRDDLMHYHLTGTNYFEPIRDEAFNQTRDLWDQHLVSEDGSVYRGEYLAYLILREAATADARGEHAVPMDLLLHGTDQELLAAVQKFMGPRYAEGYVKGVHDVDAAKIVRALATMHSTIGLLRFDPQARAMARVAWKLTADAAHRDRLAARLRAYGAVTRTFSRTARGAEYIAELTALVEGFAEATQLFDVRHSADAGRYLFSQLTVDSSFVISPEAADMLAAFRKQLKSKSATQSFDGSVREVEGDAVGLYRLLRGWIEAFAEIEHGDGDGDEQLSTHAEYIDEAAALLLEEVVDTGSIIRAHVTEEVTGLLGDHKRIVGGKMALHFNQFMRRLDQFAGSVVPRFSRYMQMKHDLLESNRNDMRLDEFKPGVLTSFVRNRLIDSVFLPLIGDNLAKQMGVVGEGKRTDRMGMLLLISPPGYGKTTLMEYIANRLGVVFMKINGPAIGTRVTSLDPAEAPNAAAREEINKLNLALEMGDNVMIYLDDIQHTNPELLQKFISLCDAQRRIEGVYKGKTRTYDLRGRKVAVVMAGNPYTESGEKFRIPDMLANRADTYNLGDIIGEHGDAFKLSYLEIAITSNPALNKLASRSQKDVYAIVRMAETGQREGVELEGNWSLEEVDEMVSVMQKLVRVRDIVLMVNQAYIRSAGMEEQFRTEPPFLLQGSYRNMNRIAEKIVPLMNDDELQTLILATYEQDAQTLTTGAEANLLKFKHMFGCETPDEAERWQQIKRTFARNQQFRGMDQDDKVSQAVVALSGVGEGLAAIRDTIRSGVSQLKADETDEQPQPTLRASLDEGTIEALRDLLREWLSTSQQDAPAQAPMMRASFDADALALLRELADKLAESRAALPAAAAPSDEPESDGEADDETNIRRRVLSGDDERTIHIVNKVPETFLYILQQQHRIMEKWLEPLGQAGIAQSQNAREMRKSISELQQSISRVIGKLEKSRESGDTGDTAEELSPEPDA